MVPELTLLNAAIFYVPAWDSSFDCFEFPRYAFAGLYVRSWARLGALKAVHFTRIFTPFEVRSPAHIATSIRPWQSNVGVVELWKFRWGWWSHTLSTGCWQKNCSLGNRFRWPLRIWATFRQWLQIASTVWWKFVMHVGPSVSVYHVNLGCTEIRLACDLSLEIDSQSKSSYLLMEAPSDLEHSFFTSSR